MMQNYLSYCLIKIDGVKESDITNLKFKFLKDFNKNPYSLIKFKKVISCVSEAFSSIEVPEEVQECGFKFFVVVDGYEMVDGNFYSIGLLYIASDVPVKTVRFYEISIDMENRFIGDPVILELDDDDCHLPSDVGKNDRYRFKLGDDGGYVEVLENRSGFTNHTTVGTEHLFYMFSTTSDINSIKAAVNCDVEQYIDNEVRKYKNNYNKMLDIKQQFKLKLLKEEIGNE